MSNPHAGSNFDDFLKQENIYEEVTLRAVKRVIAMQIKMEMEKKDIKKRVMAEAMKTSRSALNRLLDEDDTSLTLTTLAGAARVLGLKLNITLEAESKPKTIPKVAMAKPKLLEVA